MTDSAPTNRQMLADPTVLTAALGRHGVGQNRTPADLHGDVQHLLAPVIGRMRLQTDPDLYVLERLELALALAKLAGSTPCAGCGHPDVAHVLAVPFPCSVDGCLCAELDLGDEAATA